MSIQAVAWALEQDLPARPKLVLVSLANHANHTDGYCWLKAATIAAEAACTPRSVYRFIGGLTRNGYLRKAPRKGEDGKQRANDYWVLFHREPKEWDWGAELGKGEDDAEQGDGAEAETQDVVEPHDRISHGETALPDDSPVLRQAENPPAVSHGPGDSGVSRESPAEPSKTKPEDARAAAFVPRSYRPPPPPPPQPIAAVAGNRFFAFEGTPAYEAWAKYRAKERGIDRWHLVTTKVENGKHRSGWYFPSLFPPPTDTATHGGPGPPGDDPLMDESTAELKKHG